MIHLRHELINVSILYVVENHPPSFWTKQEDCLYIAAKQSNFDVCCNSLGFPNVFKMQELFFGLSYYSFNVSLCSSLLVPYIAEVGEIFFFLTFLSIKIVQTWIEHYQRMLLHKFQHFWQFWKWFLRSRLFKGFFPRIFAPSLNPLWRSWFQQIKVNIHYLWMLPYMLQPLWPKEFC